MMSSKICERDRLVHHQQGILDGLRVVVQGIHDLVVGMFSHLRLQNKTILESGHLFQNVVLELPVAVVLLCDVELLPDREVLFLGEVCFGLDALGRPRVQVAEFADDQHLALLTIRAFILEGGLQTLRILGDHEALVLDIPDVLFPGLVEVLLHCIHPVVQGADAVVKGIQALEQAGLQFVLDSRHLGLEHALQSLVRFHPPLDLRVQGLLETCDVVLQTCHLGLLGLPPRLYLHVDLPLESREALAEVREFHPSVAAIGRACHGSSSGGRPYGGKGRPSRNGDT
mmetsp:Transcript_3660/g.13483  ORF Transcript_3660/g.13483 Transcript_3660/m.13483 type:complete len:285 (+) Transcript_3660:155-1009(+)